MNLAAILIVALVGVAIWGIVALGSYINPVTGKREWWR